jgi:hypothetical protein
LPVAFPVAGAVVGTLIAPVVLAIIGSYVSSDSDDVIVGKLVGMVFVGAPGSIVIEGSLVFVLLILEEHVNIDKGIAISLLEPVTI